MYAVFILLIFSVFIRRFIPAGGFLLDEEVEQLTAFGAQRKIELRNLEGCTPEDMVTISSHKLNTNTQQTFSKPVSEGIDLTDIKAKQRVEVDTDYMYANMDAGDESLADALRKGGLK